MVDQNDADAVPLAYVEKRFEQLACFGVRGGHPTQVVIQRVDEYDFNVWVFCNDVHQDPCGFLQRACARQVDSFASSLF
jgi:hypothetical protein